MLTRLLLCIFVGCADALWLRGEVAPSNLVCEWSPSSPVVSFSLQNDTSLEAIDDLAACQDEDCKTYRRDHADFKVKRQAYSDAAARVWHCPPFFNVIGWGVKMWHFSDDWKDLKVKKQAYLEANAKLLASIEKLLETPHADKAVLARAAGGQLGADALIAFYAPWCPHCQTFVFHDGSGNPEKAPLEVMRKKWAQDEKLKSVKVYRSDVTRLNKGELPQKMPVQGIPTIYFVTAKGAATRYKGDPHDTPAVTAWAQSLASK